jgi:hypothetical protein
MFNKLTVFTMCLVATGWALRPIRQLRTGELS